MFIQEDVSCESAWNKLQKIADTFPCYFEVYAGIILTYIIYRQEIQIVVGSFCLFCSFLSTSEDDPTREGFLSFTCVFS